MIFSKCSGTYLIVNRSFENEWLIPSYTMTKADSTLRGKNVETDRKFRKEWCE